MLAFHQVCNMNIHHISGCRRLIDASFAENRFDDYTHVITYIKNEKVVGFIGIYDNLLNQICTDSEYKKQGIATEMINVSKDVLDYPIYLYIDKNKPNTQYLLNFYTLREFHIDSENEVEYKLVYDNVNCVRKIFELFCYYLKFFYNQIKNTRLMYFSKNP